MYYYAPHKGALNKQYLPILLFEKDRAAMDREIRGAPVKVGCVYVNASSVDLPVP